jgi:hypothetical protein
VLTIISRLPLQLRADVHRKLRLSAPAPLRHQVFLAQPGPDASHISQLVAARAIALLTESDSSFDDQLLPILIDEMIFSPVSDDRLYAAFLIRSTPYRPSVSDSLAWAARQVRSAQEIDVLVRLIFALRIVGTARQRELAERLAGPQHPPRVRDAAIQALGHMGGKSDAGFWQGVFEQDRTHGPTSNAENEKMLNHAAYSVGIKRDIAELSRVSGDERLPTSVRRSTKWWLDLPRHMLMSAET